MFIPMFISVPIPSIFILYNCILSVFYLFSYFMLFIHCIPFPFLFLFICSFPLIFHNSYPMYIPSPSQCDSHFSSIPICYVHSVSICSLPLFLFHRNSNSPNSSPFPIVFDIIENRWHCTIDDH